VRIVFRISIASGSRAAGPGRFILEDAPAGPRCLHGRAISL
jgi:hypothetical protein